MKFLSFRFVKIFIGLFVLALTICGATAQQPSSDWTEITFPPFFPLSMSSIGSTLIAGTNNGVFISNDNGKSWIESSAGLPAPVIIRAFAKIDDTIFARTDSAGIWKSNNGAQSWTTANVGTLANQMVTDMAAQGKTLFVVTNLGKIMRSTDLGQTWVEKFQGPPVDFFNPLNVAIAGANVFALQTSRQSDKSISKLFLSSDNGENWRAANLPANSINISAITAADSVLYVTGDDETKITNQLYRPQFIWRSGDRGKSWSVLASYFEGFFFGRILDVIASGNHLVVISYTSLSPSAFGAGYSHFSTGVETFIDTEPPNRNGSPFAPLFRRAYIANNQIFVTRTGTSGSEQNFYRNNKILAPIVTTVSAANYQIVPLPSESIVSIFGYGLSLSTVAATSVPLPNSLDNTSVMITDSVGNTKSAPLFYVSPTQINFQIPPGLANGVGGVRVNLYNQIVATGIISISSTFPGLFTVNQTGEGFAAANVQRVKANGESVYEAVVQFDSGANKYKGIPINVNSAKDQVYVNLYGTGIRGRSNLENVKASVGGVEVPVSYAGAQGSYVGVDQVNILLPSTLTGKGEVEILLTVDGQVANAVKIAIQ